VPKGEGGERIFLGLVGTNSTDGRSVIPFLQPDKEAFLEYDLARLVHGLCVTHKTKVGLISGLPMAGGFDPMTRSMTRPWAVMSQLRQQFDVHTLDASKLRSIDRDIGVLVVVQPKALSDDAQYAIDQFVLRGGHLLAFVDPDATTDRGNPMDPQAALHASRASDLPTLFKAWGVRYDPGEVVLDLRDVLYFVLTIAFWLYASALVIDLRKAD
jgi:ABC-type uncharacterized transport system involved in gliding motility auxiliary subunit